MTQILYTRVQEVKNRLKGKVSFTDQPDDETAMSEQLLRRLIAEAEGEVEYDLSPRYGAPFTTINSESFEKLPERPTKELIRTLCELKSVIRVLETDFGMSGGAVDSKDYTEKSQTRYDNVVGKLTERRSKDDDQNQWKYPPLPGLALNYFNTEADDGFRGMILVTNDGHNSMDFPSRRINSPDESFFTVLMDKINDRDIL